MSKAKTKSQENATLEPMDNSLPENKHTDHEKNVLRASNRSFEILREGVAKDKEIMSSKDYCIIEWKPANVLSVGAHSSIDGPLTRILSGYNKIKTSVWDYLKKHPIMKMHIEDEDLVLITDKGFLDWTDLEKNKALKIIKKYNDVLELEHIMANMELDSSIRIAARQQYDKIMKLVHDAHKAKSED